IKGNYDTTDNNLTFGNGVSTVKKEPQEVTFDTSDIDVVIPSIKVVEGEPFSSLPTVEKEGYTFEGWYIGDELILPTTIVNLKDGQILRPKFTLTNYTVTLVNNTGGNISSPSISLTYGGTNTFTVTPSSGYYLSGVNCTNGYTTNARVGTTQTSAQTITVSNNNNGTASSCTITYTPINYTITSNYASGTGNNPTSYNVTSNTITLGTPTRAGYTFIGWTGSNGTTPQTSVTIPKGSTGNKTYTANWTVKSYTATLKANSGGTVGSSSISINHGGTKTFTVTPSTGYYLSGLSCTNGYTTNAKTGTSQTASQTITLSNNSKDATTTCTASFTPVNYSITYNMNSGTNNSSNPTSYNITSNAITLGTPTRAGYTFVGWTGSNGTTPQTNVTIPKGSTGNKTYTANWIEVNFSIDITTEGMGGYLEYNGSPTNSYRVYVGNNIENKDTSVTLVVYGGYYLSEVRCTNGYTARANTDKTSQIEEQGETYKSIVRSIVISSNRTQSSGKCTIITKNWLKGE
ncbi:MAG: InlB B-repeat-containing protein, partial [Bacilli bacterium]|nr:InlB B-repeat-containing protein [Bacilli bacterium]